MSGAAFLVPASASAAQVKGIVDPPISSTPNRALGYTKTRVAGPARGAAVRRGDVALYLRVKESLPISTPSEPFKVTVSGLRLVPSIAACVLDGKVSFKNDDKSPVTIEIDQKPLELQPGESKTYDCTSAEPNLRRITVKEWSHIRGSLFVGEVGVVAQPSANGAFALQAPQGKYELDVVGGDGVLHKQDVEIAKGDIDLGRIALGNAVDSGAGDAQKPEPKPAQKPAKARPGVQPKRKPAANEAPLAPTLQFEKEGSEQ